MILKVIQQLLYTTVKPTTRLNECIQSKVFEIREIVDVKSN